MADQPTIKEICRELEKLLDDSNYLAGRIRREITDNFSYMSESDVERDRSTLQGDILTDLHVAKNTNDILRAIIDVLGIDLGENVGMTNSESSNPNVSLNWEKIEETVRKKHIP